MVRWRNLFKSRKALREMQNHGPDPEFELYPVVIRQTRYSGVYEGGRWAAFPNMYRFPEDTAFGDDVSCANYWASSEAMHVGRGETPQEAYEDLVRRNAYRWEKPPERRNPRYRFRLWVKKSPEGASPNAIFFKNDPEELYWFEVDQDVDQYPAPKYPNPNHPNPKFR